MTRRLSTRPSGPLRRVERQVRAVERWARSFEAVFPEGSEADGNAHWHLPVDQRLVDPATATASVQARCAQALITGAALVSAARPHEKAHMRVAALIDLPSLFMSQICVFFDPAYFRGFTDRTHECQQWTPLPPERSLARDWNLDLPPGFVERGFHEIIRDRDADDRHRLVVTHEGEIWMFADTGQ
jgi:hypothetical protein